MSETRLLNLTRLEAGKRGARVFRNQVGHYKLADGRRITSGLMPGSSDLIGWTEIEVTPDMVGRKVAVFTSLECKIPAWTPREKDKTWQGQKAWLAAVRDSGGISGVVQAESDVGLIIETYKKDKK